MKKILRVVQARDTSDNKPIFTIQPNKENPKFSTQIVKKKKIKSFTAYKK